MSAIPAARTLLLAPLVQNPKLCLGPNKQHNSDDMFVNILFFSNTKNKIGCIGSSVVQRPRNTLNKTTSYRKI